MSEKVVPISDKFHYIGPTDGDALVQALSKALSGSSDTVVEYEKALAGYFESRHAIGISSGGAALSVALYAAGVRPGDEVVLTPTSPLCTVYPVLAHQAVPVFVDTRPDNFGIDLADLERAVTSRTKAIIDIPMWGYPTPAIELRNAAKARGIPLIFDLAHSHGTKLDGKHLSAYADLSCFSTHDRKILATGEGGFILTDDDRLAEVVQSYRQFGNLNGKDLGLNYKLGALQAAIGKSRLGLLDGHLQSRRNNAERIAADIRNPRVKEFTVLPGSRPSYYFMLLSLGFKDNRAFIDHLDAHGIPSDIKRYGCKTLYKSPLLKPWTRNCPNAEALLDSITTIPVHPNIKAEQVNRIVSAINSYEGV
ncbi:DegT/DnrJ/EryC1/StrS family aminotransferase [Pendulispora albinea]|uniref:Aminotransferase class I/II-fold pyridoxal phosphate-dependent enzyme n=1 Tax=Pendulispora albinea TaxID=2741071 RepID=A0ABZ2M1X2_9BACT